MKTKLGFLPRLISLLVLALIAAVAFGEGASQSSPDAQTAKTRKGQLLEARKEKATSVVPAEPSKVVEVLSTIENDGIDQIVSVQFRHWRFGFGKISPVSGGTPAIQYERPRLGGTGVRLRTSGAYSFRGYQAYDFRLGWFDNPAPYQLSGSGLLGAQFDFDQRSQRRPRNFLYADIRYRDFPSEDFFGLGPDSLESNRTSYRYEDAAIDAVAGLQPLRWMGLQFRVGHLRTNVGPGKDDKTPSAEELFAPEVVPGLLTQPEFLHLESALYLVRKGDPNLPSGELGLTLSRFSDVDEAQLSFNRLSIDARGVLPLGSRQRALAARVFASRDYADAGHQVPFYLMHSLGGHDTLRGYADFRFRDANALYFSTEYRWEATAGIELATFYDTGKVFQDRAGFTFENLRHSYGIGIRGKTMEQVVFRLEVARSEEGCGVYVSLGPSF